VGVVGSTRQPLHSVRLGRTTTRGGGATFACRHVFAQPREHARAYRAYRAYHERSQLRVPHLLGGETHRCICGGNLSVASVPCGVTLCARCSHLCTVHCDGATPARPDRFDAETADTRRVGLTGVASGVELWALTRDDSWLLDPHVLDTPHSPHAARCAAHARLVRTSLTRHCTGPLLLVTASSEVAPLSFRPALDLRLRSSARGCGLSVGGGGRGVVSLRFGRVSPPRGLAT